MEYAGFDWDEGNRAKCGKHGVSIAEIEGLFSRTVMVGPDPKHSAHEERFIAIGTTRRDRKVLVVFTLRQKSGATFIRPISARYMHRKEIEAYEKKASKAEE